MRAGRGGAGAARTFRSARSARDRPYTKLCLPQQRKILSDRGATEIFVTHDQEEALSIADEVAVMLDGEVEAMLRPESVELLPGHEATGEVALGTI